MTHLEAPDEDVDLPPVLEIDVEQAPSTVERVELLVGQIAGVGQQRLGRLAVTRGHHEVEILDRSLERGMKAVTGHQPHGHPSDQPDREIATGDHREQPAGLDLKIGLNRCASLGRHRCTHPITNW